MNLFAIAVLTPIAAIYLTGDTDPYRGYMTMGVNKSSCCGGTDCATLPDGDVKAVPGGYDVFGWGFVSNGEAQPGFDFHYHLCEYPKGVRRCFLTPSFGI